VRTRPWTGAKAKKSLYVVRATRSLLETVATEDQRYLARFKEGREKSCSISDVNDGGEIVPPLPSRKSNKAEDATIYSDLQRTTRDANSTGVNRGKKQGAVQPRGQDAVKRKRRKSVEKFCTATGRGMPKIVEEAYVRAGGEPVERQKGGDKCLQSYTPPCY